MNRFVHDSPGAHIYKAVLLLLLGKSQGMISARPGEAATRRGPTIG
jgi:hypothetical protein